MESRTLKNIVNNLASTTDGFRNRWIDYILALQNTICAELEKADGKAVFQIDEWQRNQTNIPGQEKKQEDAAHLDGGGGSTRIITQGNIFEKGGVNTSVVYGKVSDQMRQQLGIEADQWFACGLSLVLHPFNPFVPTTHANWRYFELYDESGEIINRWFGGGADLTPYYLFEEDARHFHHTLKNAMQPFGENLYNTYKKNCDQYFNNAHRGFEMRGIGGVFYDHLQPASLPKDAKNPANMDLEKLFAFQRAGGDQFLNAYLPIVKKRKDRPYDDQQKYWQEIRRGRYVEFNLIHDRGTLFGLKTNGRTESILMSLPPTVRFDYNFQPTVGSEEWKLLQACKEPRDWA